MTTSRQYLEAIANDPDNDAPRLAYADWLTDRKDSLGEFIRIQLQLGQMAPADPARAKLQRRERSLLGANRKKWVEALPAWARSQHTEFYRGFPRVWAKVGDWLKGGEKLAATFPVDNVKLAGGDEGSIRKLASAPSLLAVRWLDVSYLPLAGIPGALLCASPHLKYLTRFYLWQTGLDPDGGRALADSPHLGSLRKLILDETHIGPAGAAAVFQSRHLRSLVDLDIGSCRLQPDEALSRALADSPITPRLESLGLGTQSTGMGTAAGCALFQQPLPRLKSLHLNGNQLEDDAAQALGSAELGPLETLDVSYNQITDAGVLAILGNKYLSLLTSLSVGLNPFSPAAVVAIAKSRPLSNLTDLKIRNADVGDAGATALAAATFHDTLGTLHLPDARIGDAGATALAAARFPSLKSFWIADNAFGKEARAALKARFGKSVQV